ncbi:TetR/AcrR family transcriptional regulator [Nocardiopsis mangrovi]|uniref:TetR/AcrR family transcriptional regulator n=1 Tax=Nocardiopsis mangrovi TaxID=1179818 RepID=A0ABV9DPH7_9ACTN
MVRPSVDTGVILEAAAELVAERGFDSVTMAAIAGRAGVAKGVLYLRFSNKDELLAAIVAHEAARATRRTAELVEADPRGGMLSRLYVHSVTALHSRPALLRLYRGDPPHLARVVRDRDGSRHRSRALLGAGFIRELQAEGMVDPSLDAGVLAANLALWSHGLAARAPHDDLEALILGMGELVARAADTDVADSTPGKRCFARFAAALVREGAPA